MIGLPSRAIKFYVVVVDVVTRSLLRDGGIVEGYGAPEAVLLPWAWTRGRGETTVAKESVAGQCRTR